MKRTRITFETTETGTYLKLHRPLPALFWAELLKLLGDWRKFENGKRGTRFDRWVNYPRLKAEACERERSCSQKSHDARVD